MDEVACGSSEEYRARRHHYRRGRVYRNYSPETVVCFETGKKVCIIYGRFFIFVYSLKEIKHFGLIMDLKG